MLGDSVRRRQPRGRGAPAADEAPKGKRRRRWKPLLIGVPLALLAPFGIGYLLAVFVIFPPREVRAAGIAVPDLIGKSEGDAQRELGAAGLGLLEVTELPHPDVAAGRVVAQSPLPGQQLHAGAPVRVALSAGKPRAMVPDVIGFAADRAQSLLMRSGFTVEFVTRESLVEAGRVIGSDPQPGQDRELPFTVTLSVSAGPPAQPPPDTMVIDTITARPPL